MASSSSSSSSSPPPLPPFPDIFDPSSLLAEGEKCLRFFSRDACRIRGGEAPSPSRPFLGGSYHFFAADGSVHDPSVRHIVSTTRLVVQFAWAVHHYPEEEPRASAAPPYRALLADSLAFLRGPVHFRPATGGYAWEASVSEDGSALLSSDETVYTYALAFALLAYSAAYRFGGVEEAKGWVEETWETLSRLWEEGPGLYANECGADFAVVDPYRGQNSNMHAVEAHVAAYEATGERKHLERARRIAEGMCVGCAGRVGQMLRAPPRPGGGDEEGAGAGEEREDDLSLVYEHYTSSWEVDLAFNADKRDDVFRPWGFQPGHLMEWAKLLVQLDAHREDEDGEGAAWRLPVAERFFAAALRGWDDNGGVGGLVYSLSPEPSLPVANGDKYKWVQVEGLAAAGLIAEAVGRKRAALGETRNDEAFYWGWYERLWEFSWRFLVDHEFGSWQRYVDRDGRVCDGGLKCPPGKVDYHINAACYDVGAVLERRRRRRGGKG
jgi:mannose/cellobiose epimerase-like protein (N-acyl-D-glucosamine 2-epimerase family)